jgi:nitrite reductase/ring-hydroxylating ferredoxin subunit
METARAITASARRRLLKWLCAIGIGAPALVLADEADDAALAPPQAGDRLVIAFGDRAGMPIAPEDLGPGSRQVFAYAQDPSSGVIRSGSRLNQVLVIRLDPAILSEETRARSAGGVVAYSGVCSHTGCDVTDWDANAQRFQCPCHESQFDPADAARVVGGPAPWQLAALPLTLVDGKLGVTDSFIGRVGFMPPGQDLFGL